MRKRKLTIWMLTDQSGMTVTPPPSEARAAAGTRMRPPIPSRAAPVDLQRIPVGPIEMTSIPRVVETAWPDLIFLQGWIRKCAVYSIGSAGCQNVFSDGFSDRDRAGAALIPP